MKNFHHKKFHTALTAILIYTQIIPSLAVADTIIPGTNNTTQAPTGMSSTTLQTAENTAQAKVEQRNESVQAQSALDNRQVNARLGDFGVSISKNLTEKNATMILKTKGPSSPGGTHPFRQIFMFFSGNQKIYFSQQEWGKETISGVYQPDSQAWREALNSMISDVGQASALSKENDKKLKVIASDLIRLGKSVTQSYFVTFGSPESPSYTVYSEQVIHNVLVVTAHTYKDSVDTHPSTTTYEYFIKTGKAQITKDGVVETYDKKGPKPGSWVQALISIQNAFLSASFAGYGGAVTAKDAKLFGRAGRAIQHALSSRLRTGGLDISLRNTIDISQYGNIILLTHVEGRKIYALDVKRRILEVIDTATSQSQAYDMSISSQIASYTTNLNIMVTLVQNAIAKKDKDIQFRISLGLKPYSGDISYRASLQKVKKLLEKAHAGKR